MDKKLTRAYSYCNILLGVKNKNLILDQLINRLSNFLRVPPEDFLS